MMSHMSSEQCAAELQTASWTASVPSKTTTSDRAARGGAHAHTGRRGGPRASIGLADSSAYPRRRPRDSRASASIGPLGGVVLSRALHGGSTRRVLLARRAPSRAPRRAREGERAAPPPGARRVRGFRRGEASRRCRPLGRRALARRLLAEPDGRRRRRGAVRGDVEERVPAETREQPDARRGRDGEPAPARGTGQRGGDGAGARAKRAAPRLRAVGGDDGGIPRRDPSLGDLRAVGGDDGVRSPPRRVTERRGRRAPRGRARADVGGGDARRPRDPRGPGRPPKGSILRRVRREVRLPAGSALRGGTLSGNSSGEGNRDGNGEDRQVGSRGRGSVSVRLGRRRTRRRRV